MLACDRYASVAAVLVAVALVRLAMTPAVDAARAYVRAQPWADPDRRLIGALRPLRVECPFAGGGAPGARLGATAIASWTGSTSGAPPGRISCGA